MPDTILTPGATGECVEQLVVLLQAAGYPPVVTLTPREKAMSVVALFEPSAALDSPALDTSVLGADVLRAVAAAQQDLGIVEPIEIEPAGTVIKGVLITQLTWDGLRAAAAKRTGLVSPTVAADTQAKAAIETAPTGQGIPSEQVAADASSDLPAEVDTPSELAKIPATGAEAAQQAAVAAAAQAAAWQPPATEAEA